MHFVNDHESFNLMDRVLIGLNDVLRRMSDDGTWQDCADTNQAEVLRMRADIIEVRDTLQQIHRHYLGGGIKWTDLPDATIINIIRSGEGVK